MLRVAKRDNSIVDFDIKKIEDAMQRAFDEEHKSITPDLLELLALRTTAEFSKKVKKNFFGAEIFQDAVEIVLIPAGYVDVSKSYMDYRRKHQELRDLKKTELNYASVVDNYLKVNDWRVKENSTVTYSVGGLILSNSGAVTANYWLSQVYDKEIADAHRNADMHIHDLSMLTG